MKLVYWFLVSLGLSAFWSLEQPEAVAVAASSTCACDRTTDSLTLVELYDSTSVISDWQDPWDFSMPMDTWEGVVLNSIGCVLELRGGDSWNGSLPAALGNLEALQELAINGDELTGSIPSAIGNLTQLRELTIESNSISGNIPASIGDLGFLRELKIQSTSISGNIPETLYDLIFLRQLELFMADLDGILSEKIDQLISLEYLLIHGDNSNGISLSGSIPSSIGNLTNLRYLNIRNTNIGSSIPPSIGGLVNLTTLNLLNNSLSGPLPEELAQLTNLRTLNFYGNQLNGSLPNWIGDLSSLNSLGLSGNNFEGVLPTSIGNLTDLTGLYLGQNNFTDSLPSSWSNLTKLLFLDVNQNNLSGPLPSWLDALQGLVTIDFSQNDFTGEIPISWINIPKLFLVNLYENKLTGAVPPFNFISPIFVTLNIEDNQLQSLPVFPDSINWSTGSAGLEIKNNKFTFDDVLPNLEALDNSFGPQDTVYVDTIIALSYQDSVTIDLGIDPYLASNNYRWYKDTSMIALIEGNNKFTIANAQPSDAGTYICRITNDSIFTFALALITYPIEITVSAPGRISDSLELVRFYLATDGDNWIDSWDLQMPMDTWGFVTLEQDRVTEINFPTSNNLNGTLIDIQLPLLTEFIITDDKLLSGPLPNFSGIPELRRLDIEDCSLAGPIPLFPNLGKLENLILSENNLTEGIPKFENLPFLNYISLRGNQLSGEFLEPNFLPRLRVISIEDNIGLEGNLPTFDKLPELTGIFAENCNFRGAIPTFTNNPNFQDLSVVNNNFTSIPDTFNQLNFRQLAIAYNDIYGPFPFFSSTQMTYIRTEGNQFYGPLPDLNRFVDGPQKLLTAIFSNNNFSGAIPDVSALDNLHFYYLDGNQFTSLPDLSQIESWSDCTGNCGVLVQNNVLSFDDIIPNVDLVVDGSWQYQPQDSFLQKTEVYLAPNESYTIQLHIDEDLTTNTYQWSKNGFPLTTTTENFLTLNNLDEIRTDTFHCQVTNPAVSDLVLNSRATIIHVCAPFLEVIDPLLCVGESIEVNGTVYDELTPEGMELIDVPNELGCDSLLEIALRFYPKSEKIINDTISEGSSVELNGTSYDATGNYEVLLVGQGYTGCDSSIALNLVVAPITAILENEFPNSFTPNNDGINDYFVIPALDAQPEEFINQAFTVFNRESQVLYRAQPYNNDWDGTSMQGQALPTGTYYYIFRYEREGKEMINKGNILLNR